MEDYLKTFFRLLLSIVIFFRSSVALIDLDDICGFPGAPAFGWVEPDQEMYETGDSVAYYCRAGYILLGAPTNWCTEDGTWSEEIPICDESMTTLGRASSTDAVPGHDANMAIDRIRDTCTILKPNERPAWRFHLGQIHKILSVSVTVTSTDQMKFTIYVTEAMGNSLSHKRCVFFNGKFGTSTIRFSCSEGKGLEGQAVFIENNLPHEYFEICEVEVQVEKDTGYECGRPDRRPFSMNYQPQGGKVEYACQTGYELIGDRERECLDTGEWSDEAPVCKPVICDPLRPPENGQLTFSVKKGDIPLEGSTASYICSYGYRLEGPSTRRCVKGGIWTGEDPVCKIIRCPIPQGNRDGESYRLLNTTNRVGTVAKLVCKKGKGIMVGDDPFITCTENGDWTEPKAHCVPLGGAEKSSSPPRIVNRGGIIFGMAAAAIMVVIIMVSFYIVKRRREANKPQLPSRQQEPISPPPRPPPREKGLKSTLKELVSRDSSGYKYASLENGKGGAAWKTRSLPVDSGNSEVAADEQGAPRRTLSYDDPEKLASRGTDVEIKPDKAGSEGTEEASEKDSRVTTPVKSGDEYAAVNYDKKRQSRLLKEQESQDTGQETPAAPEQLRELPPIPKEEEEEETRAPSAASPSTDKEREASVESEDVSLPIAPSESQTSEAPTPSPDVVVENQVEGPSASPPTTPSETTPGRRRQRGEDQTSAEEVPETRRTRTRRRTEPEVPESPPPAPAEGERPSRRTRTGRTEEPESPPPAPAEDERRSRRARGRVEEPESPPPAPVEDERPTRRGRAGRQEDTESPPAVPVEEERPARRTRPGVASRYDPPTSTFQPSYRRRY